MRITESRIRQIIREESKQVIAEGFNTETGLPIDSDGVKKTIENMMSKLAKGGGISKQEYWTVYMICQLAVHDASMIDNVAKQLVNNNDSISKHL